MDITNLQNQIEELETKLDESRKLYDTMNLQFQEFQKIFTEHNHTGKDMTGVISNYLDLKKGQPIYFDGGGIETGNIGTNGEEKYMGFAVGNDRESSDGSDNTQLLIQHQPQTNDTTKQSFIYGSRTPLFQGTRASVSSGGTVATITEHNFKSGELEGASILVKQSDSVFEVHKIASNGINTVTISGGTWSFSSSTADWTIFTPVYFGSAQTPWRRLYTANTSDGGLRFGYGNTGSAQNAHLYFNDNKIVFRYNDAGTTRYKYLSLTGTGVTWIHTTTAV